MHHVLRALPLPLASAIGAPMGAYAGHFSRKIWHGRADAALAALRPDLDAATRERLLRWRWRHLGRSLAEFAHLHRMLPKGRVEIVGATEIMRQPGPRLVVSAHLGNWEMLGPTIVELAGGVIGPYQPPTNPVRHAIARRARARYGARAAQPGRAAAFAVARELKVGGAALMYMDEVIAGRRLGPVFDGPPPMDGNIAAAARLAVRFGAALIPAYCLRLGGARFRVAYEDPLRADPAAPRESEELRLAAVLNDRVAGWIRAHPEQWLMLHERPR